MKAVLVFCEGRHDVVFAQRSLGAHGNCSWVGGQPISELPSPFGRSKNNSGQTVRKGLIEGLFEHSANVTLQAAAHSPLPCFDAAVANTAKDTMFFLVRTSGKTNCDPVLKFLTSLDLTLNTPKITNELGMSHDVSQYAAAFLYDADDEGVASTLQAFRDRYTEHFGDLSALQHGQWLQGNTAPVGCFVFHGSDQQPTGTIEDHLAPMAEQSWPDRYAAAQALIDDGRHDSDQVSRSNAERLKAIITVAGQFNHPGDPLSVIIGRNGMPQEQFEACAVSRELALFLLKAPLAPEHR